MIVCRNPGWLTHDPCTYHSLFPEGLRVVSKIDHSKFRGVYCLKESVACVIELNLCHTHEPNSVTAIQPHLLSASFIQVFGGTSHFQACFYTRTGYLLNHSTFILFQPMEEIKKEQLKNWVSFLLIFAEVTSQQLLHHGNFCNTSLHCCISWYVIKIHSLFSWSLDIQLTCFVPSSWKVNAYIQLSDALKLRKLWTSE